MHVARLATRVLIGGLFVGHGTQKLFGSFGGSGIEATAQTMTAIGMHPGDKQAYAAGVTEAGAGALLAAGLFTPLASAGLIGTMVTAIAKVHGTKGPWITGGGWEYNAVLIAACAYLAETGPGKVSLDALIGRERSGAKYGLGALALGTAASFGAMELAKRNAPTA